MDVTQGAVLPSSRPGPWGQPLLGAGEGPARAGDWGKGAGPGLTNLIATYSFV